MPQKKSRLNIEKKKSEFITLASHQLRTPLSIIKWYTEMLRDEEAGHLNLKQKKYLTEIYMAAERMMGLTNELLHVSELEMGTLNLNLQPVDIREVADTVIEELMAEIGKKKINFSKKYDEKLVLLKLDWNLLHTIFYNLLLNSIKYTPAGGEIGLFIKRKGKEVEIVIFDTGYGIPKTEQKQVFTKLFRAGNVKKTDTDGAGLGLYLVKAIVEKIGGQIWFESEENRGTAFFVNIPGTAVRINLDKKSNTQKNNPSLFNWFKLRKV